MRKLIPLLLLTFSAPAFAQSVITIPPQQCLWRAGDNPAWAAPNLDETSWRPYSDWKPTPGKPHYWVRCRANLSALGFIKQPAIQITLASAYELFLNGVQIGAAGDLRNGQFSMNSMKSYAIPGDLLPAGTAAIVLRITSRYSLVLIDREGMLKAPVQINAGDALLLDSLRDHERIVRSTPFFAPTICFGAIGVAALIMLGIYFVDRSRHELLLLSLACLSLTLISLIQYAGSSLIDYPFSASGFLRIMGNVAGPFAEFPFFFVLVRRRVPSIIWILLGITVLTWVPSMINCVAAANEPVWLGPLAVSFFRPLSIVSHTTLSLSPFIAFWPFSGIPRRSRAMAILCMLWGGADVVWYGISITSFPALGMSNLFVRSLAWLFDVRAFTITGVLIALLALLFREQRHVIEERALLAGEMQAASQIQRMLAPAVLDCAPGLQIDVAFHPMREVGGDFYLSRVLPRGRQRLLIGDVSGKGSAAAMTAALLLGGASSRDSDSPAQLLAHLNRVLAESRVSGFATCLCADFAPDGSVVLANAGHLPPYLHAEEIATPSGLPLGLNPPDCTFEPHEFTLAPGDTLTFLSDGVVEARSTSGELFGFDRARAISTQSAQQIAREAQTHGQEDDITVLTLTFAPVGVAHA